MVLFLFQMLFILFLLFSTYIAHCAEIFSSTFEDVVLADGKENHKCFFDISYSNRTITKANVLCNPLKKKSTKGRVH